MTAHMGGTAAVDSLILLVVTVHGCTADVKWGFSVSCLSSSLIALYYYLCMDHFNLPNEYGHILLVQPLKLFNKSKHICRYEVLTFYRAFCYNLFENIVSGMI